MKSLTNTFMVAAVALAAVAGAASAQTMKAEVPFSFEVAGMVMPAGTYHVTPSSTMGGTPLFRIANADLKNPVLVKPVVAHGGATAYTEAKLVFRCSGGNCALSQIWTGSDIGSYDLNTPKSVREQASLIAIPATRAD